MDNEVEKVNKKNKKKCCTKNTTFGHCSFGGGGSQNVMGRTRH